jgi:hypothetical protein
VERRPAGTPTGVVSRAQLHITDNFTAAEDLLEIIMRRYERASTLLTSNLLCGAPHNAEHF